MDEPRNFMLEAYEQARRSMEGSLNDIAAKALEKAYAPNKVEDTIDPSEALGKLAYDTYQYSKYQRASETLPWGELPLFWRKNWIDVAEAVKKQVKEQENG